MKASNFAASMHDAITAKEEAEARLADAVAQSAIQIGENEDELELARQANLEAQERVSQLCEEASLYAEREAEATERLNAMSQELSNERRRREEAERKSEEMSCIAAEARYSAELATSEAEARSKNGEEIQRRDRELREQILEMTRRAMRAEDGEKAAQTSATAALSLLVLEQESNTNELIRARTAAEHAQNALSEARRSAELELSEARREAELHRQRRLHARSELVTVAKALEATRSEARETEATLEKELVPRLLRHSNVIASLVQRANAAASSIGGGGKKTSLARRHSPNIVHGGSTSSYNPDSAFPTKYLGDLAHEIHRIESGLDLLNQSFDLIDDAVEKHHDKNGTCYNYLRALLELGSSTKKERSSSKTTSATGRRIRFAASVVSTPRTTAAGYSRVRLESPLDAPYDDDQVL
uniref:Uncharacterized protein n=1 Tax=Aureoumbra lagunensis TaxID=44058 RepID=A0A7S3K5I9_9STRA|mmetsp:Transcript_1431/g.1876  ORF Transcript_1431/g.1876 Transcript_1431/m.1876 type:complete len:418 (+) Transcript_1431:143-1396(+)|eukprot:CAMPEP_0197292260 /NCGR_PEP_ID=MMETSP0890-20130614/22159_1 /TAXON_ID=44058 ORGANISM="Aureoumbra lagunensis, Strain CCMP1510" /NCGR_SAMPLE_ID=MMETSP0890 /ASSEMBLY_ACC=CAM_ASM_000533 /LENGTH=417 /DNA_ID=CAMNT_0042766023 /DNA_START=75 /DNA_END=1328 /DNA_ORIENTATION=-